MTTNKPFIVKLPAFFTLNSLSNFCVIISSRKTTTKNLINEKIQFDKKLHYFLSLKMRQLFSLQPFLLLALNYLCNRNINSSSFAIESVLTVFCLN